MSQGELTRRANAASRRSVYASAVDWWIVVVLMLGPVICVGITGVLLQQGRPQDALYCLLAGAGTLLATAMFTVPCRYTILADTLSIRCGILFMRVPLHQIKSIERSRSWLSGPALSLKRIKVSTASRFYLISPSDLDGFTEELTKAVAEAVGEDGPASGNESGDDASAGTV